MAVDTAAAALRTRRVDTFPYQEFIEREGVPIHRELVGVPDVTTLERAPWGRTGGRGAFIELRGTFEAERGIYVCEIPGGGALEPEKHLYEEEIFILEGRGTAQVWQGSGQKITFEWGPGSVFAIPVNVEHRLLNGGREPVIFMGVTSAPRVINALDDLGAVFDSDHRSFDLYSQENYFLAREQKTQEASYRQGVLHTNFIADARRVLLDDLERKVAGGQLTGYRMGQRFPHGHISEWPSGRYHKAHYHGPGAILLGLDGEGYVLAWDSRLGARPYQNGHGDQVLRVDWGKHSIYTPPNAFFHQHLNSGPGPAKHIAVYGGQHPMSTAVGTDGEEWRGFRSFKDGGTLIEYEDEDPRVRADFEATLRAKGIEPRMPPVTYRD